MKKIILVDDELSSIQKMISMLIDQYDLSFCMFKEDPLKAIEYIRNFEFLLQIFFIVIISSYKNYFNIRIYMN